MSTRRQALDAGTRLDRQQQRRALGTLSSLVVTQRTSKKYDEAVRSLFAFMKSEHIKLPPLYEEFDLVVCKYVEHCWQEGEGRSLVSNVLAGLQHFTPTVRGRLPCSWRLVSAWQRHELPARAPPLPAHLVRALAGCALRRHAPDVCVGLFVAYDGLLRTGELFGLRCKDFVVSEDCQSVIVNLGLTKGGQRRGAAESVVLYDEMTVSLLRARLLNSQPHEKLLQRSPANFRALFDDMCRELGLENWNFKPYSLRRGGATTHFQVHQSMSSVCVRGRWQNERTARLYINSGLAALASASLTPAAVKATKKAESHLHKILAGH